MKKIIITIFIIIILDVIFVRSSNTNKINNDYYNLCKIELINEVDSYIKKFAPKSEMTGTNIVNLCLTYDFDIPLALSQFHIESHFASYGVAKRTNNVANVGNMDDGTILYKFNLSGLNFPFILNVPFFFKYTDVIFISSLCIDVGSLFNTLISSVGMFIFDLFKYITLSI